MITLTQEEKLKLLDIVFPEYPSDQHSLCDECPIEPNCDPDNRESLPCHLLKEEIRHLIKADKK